MFQKQVKKKINLSFVARDLTIQLRLADLSYFRIMVQQADPLPPIVPVPVPVPALVPTLCSVNKP